MRNVTIKIESGPHLIARAVYADEKVFISTEGHTISTSAPGAIRGQTDIQIANYLAKLVDNLLTTEECAV